MITETAIVVAIVNNETWIQTQRQTACGQCSANKGCGTSVLSKVIGNKLSKMKAVNKINAQIGDEVVVGLNEASLLRGAFMTYLMPLLFLFVFALIGQFVNSLFATQNSEVIIILFAAFGFYLGLKKLKIFSNSISNDENFQPVIIKKSGHLSEFVTSKLI
jgi:sigma-E factor negative regulatory protein RseC